MEECEFKDCCFFGISGCWDNEIFIILIYFVFYFISVKSIGLVYCKVYIVKYFVLDVIKIGKFE